MLLFVAISIASSMLRMPSCVPSSSISLTSEAFICLFFRTLFFAAIVSSLYN